MNEENSWGGKMDNSTGLQGPCPGLRPPLPRRRPEVWPITLGLNLLIFSHSQDQPVFLYNMLLRETTGFMLEKWAHTKST